MNETLSRKLAVVLHADVAGSTAMVQNDEALAHERIRDAYRRFSEVIANYGGNAREIRGDALVADFSRPSDAVSAALAFQAANTERNNELTDEIRPRIRIGIAMGEVVAADNTLTGEGVVLAQRLEQIVVPGGVAVQGAARDTIPRRMPFDYEDLGEHNFKGFADPVRGFRACLRPGRSIPEPDRDTLTDKLLNKPAIAVLPFANMSGDPEQEYFSDGITEDIITALSHFRSFPVIARNSTFTYKSQAIRVQQVAEELGARYVLEGSVRKAGERLRITAQLIDGETGHHVWAEKYDRSIQDIFEIQDELTQKIVVTIEPELAQAEMNRAKLRRPENLTAWDHFLRGMYLVNLYTRSDFDAARECFGRAIDLDPGYGDAWAGLGWSYLRTIEVCGPGERQGLVEKGMAAGRKAVQLNGSSSIAHYVLGLSYVWAERFQAAISEAEISLELNPFNAQAQRGLGNRLDLVGRNAEGIAQIERSLKLNPRDPNCPKLMGYLCRAYIDKGEPDRALEVIENAIALQPEIPDLHFRRAVCLAHLDRAGEAEHELDECERLEPGFLTKRKDWKPYASEERNRRFYDGVRRHGLLHRVAGGSS